MLKTSYQQARCLLAIFGAIGGFIIAYDKAMVGHILVLSPAAGAVAAMILHIIIDACIEPFGRK